MKVVNRKYKEYFSSALQRGIKAPHPKTPILFASSLNRQYLFILVVFLFFFVGSLNQQYLLILVVFQIYKKTILLLFFNFLLAN